MTPLRPYELRLAPSLVWTEAERVKELLQLHLECGPWDVRPFVAVLQAQGVVALTMTTWN